MLWESVGGILLHCVQSHATQEVTEVQQLVYVAGVHYLVPILPLGVQLSDVFGVRGGSV